MNLSRRSFLAGSLASFGAGALGGRIFAAPPGWKPAKKPNLVFGILSDTHLMVEWNRKSVYRTMTLDYIRNAFRLFKSRGIDAFVHLGDASHRGAVREWEFHTEVFDEVFGKSGAPAKIIVVGNHELFGDCDRVKKMWPDPAQWRENAICADLPRHYERVWGEPFAEVFHKEVKGYHFFGRHWETSEQKLADIIKGKAGAFSLASEKPFFVLSHKRTHFRCNASLKKFPNAIGFCGHWHSSTANWKNIHYDDFGGFYPIINCGACRYDGENGLDQDGLMVKPDPQRDKKTNRFQFPSRQAMIVNVYGDMVVFERHEVGVGGRIGPDWVFPVGKFETKPYSSTALKGKIGAPAFPRNAKLVVSPVKSVPCLRIAIPHANGNPESRVFAYDMAVVGDDKKTRLIKSVYFSGVGSGVGHEPNGGVTTVDIPKTDIPAGKSLTIAVRPISSLGTKGKAIGGKYRSLG